MDTTSSGTTSSSSSGNIISNASSIVHSSNVYLYLYNEQLKNYEALSGAQVVGGVLMGSGVTYQLLFYNANKEHLCQAVVSSTFKYSIQSNNYVNFYATPSSGAGTGTNKLVYYAIRFKDEFELTAFVKHLVLTKIHVGMHGKPSLGLNQVHTFDIALGAGNSVQAGDTTGVRISAWKLEGHEHSGPTHVLQETPFEQTGSKELRKVKLSADGDPIRGLVNGIMGMMKGSKRLIVIPPGISLGAWLLVEVELQKVKSATSKKQSVTEASIAAAAAGLAASQAVQNGTNPTSPAPSTSSDASHESLIHRMAQLSRAGSLDWIPSSPPRMETFSSSRITTSSSNQTPSSPINSLQSPRSLPTNDFSLVPYYQDEIVKEKERLREQQNELELQKKALDEARVKMMSDHLDAQRKQLQEEQEKLEKQRLEQQKIQLATSPMGSSSTHASNTSLSSGAASSSFSMAMNPMLSSSSSTTYEYGGPPINHEFYGAAAGNSPFNYVSSALTSAVPYSHAGIAAYSSPSASMNMDVLYKVQRMSGNMEEMLSNMNGKIDRILQSVKTNTGSGLKYGAMDNHTSLGYGSYSSSVDTIHSSSSSSSSSSLMKGIEKLLHDHERTSSEIADRNERISSLEKRVEELLEKNHDMMLENGRLIEKSTLFQQKESMINNQLSLAQTAKEKMEAQMSQSQNELMYLKRNVDQLRQSESQIMKQVELEKQARLRAEEALKFENEGRVMLEKQVKGLQEQREAEKSAMLHDFEARSANERQASINQIRHLSNDMEALQQKVAERSTLEKKLVESRTVAQNLQMEVNDRDGKIVTLTKQVEEKQIQIVTAQQKIQDLEEELSKSVHPIHLAKVASHHEEHVTMLKNQHKQELEGTIERLRSELKPGNETTANDFAATIEAFTAQVESLQSQLGESEAKFEESAMQLDALKKENQEQERQLVEIAHELRKAQQSVEELQKGPGQATGQVVGLDRSRFVADTTELFKDFMNEVYFKFQDFFEEESEFVGKDVIVSIRRILKQSTVEVIQKIERQGHADT